jgi:hypothetical protein
MRNLFFASFIVILTLLNNAVYAGGISLNTDPSPYCADTLTSADSVYINGAQFGDNVIPGIQGLPYLNAAFIFFSVVKNAPTEIQIGITDFADQSLALWVDLNKDTIFSANERLVMIPNMVPSSLNTLTFTIPGTATAGLTRARIRITAGDTLLLPCADYEIGSTIDFAFIVNESAAPYCEPVSNAGCSDYDYIDSFRLNNISYQFPGIESPGYQFITQTTTLIAGDTYSFTVKNGSFYGAAVNAWIDYNSNNSFDANERINSDISLDVDSVHTFTFTVPASTAPGLKRFRIRNDTDGENLSLGPCDTIAYGMTVEFNVTINPVGINDILSGSILVSPNPTQNNWMISLSDELVGTYAFVYDIAGQLLLSEKIVDANWNLAGEKFSPGIYFMQLSDGRKLLATKKLVRQ